MTNVINFPVVKRRPDGRFYYAGWWFDTIEEVKDFMSDRDWRRAAAWQSRHWSYVEREEEKQA
jgi:hypothetical protein